MPIDRDDHDERLARIEQILEQLDRESRRFKDFKGFEPDARASAIVAQLKLSDAIADSRRARFALRRQRAARKKRR